MIRTEDEVMLSFFKGISTSANVKTLTSAIPTTLSIALAWSWTRLTTELSWAKQDSSRNCYGKDTSRSQSLHESVQSTDEDEALLNPLDTEPRGSEETKMLLLNGRTRQDIQYVTSITASRLMKCPDLVSRSGKTAGLPE